MIDPTFVTVGIPTYNGDRFVGDAVESVLAQHGEFDKSGLEILISDNASSDGTAKHFLLILLPSLALGLFLANFPGRNAGIICVKALLIVGYCLFTYDKLPGDVRAAIETFRKQLATRMQGLRPAEMLK